MKTSHILYIALFMLITGACSDTSNENASSSAIQNPDVKGHLIIVGGGPRPESIMSKIVELSNDGHILIIPMASSIPDTVGWEQRDQFNGYGATSVDILMMDEDDKFDSDVAEKIRAAGGIWFSGGDQNRLMEFLGDGILIDALFEAYRNGAVISGTSAGAAVMSRVMITGDERNPDRNRSFATIHQDNIITTGGIGLVDNMIIDQHFIRRSRLNRLISALLDHPESMAAGIDEATALWVKPGGNYEVLGDSQIILLEEGKTGRPAEAGLQSAADIRMHVLPPTSTFSVRNGKVVQVKLPE